MFYFGNATLTLTLLWATKINQAQPAVDNYSRRDNSLKKKNCVSFYLRFKDS